MSLAEPQFGRNRAPSKCVTRATDQACHAPESRLPRLGEAELSRLAIRPGLRHHKAMVIGRFFGWLLLLAAGAVIVRDAIIWADLHSLVPLSLGSLWTELSASTLRSARSSIEYLAPWLWTLVIGRLLLLWAAPVFVVCGCLFLWLFRRRRRRRFH